MLCEYAHRYGARVFVTVNTIVYEDELDDTQQLLIRLSEIGVDAVLVQDMGIIEMRRSAIAEVGHAPLLHASTQCDTRTAEKVSWLQSLGFSRAVLARELSLTEIRANMPLCPTWNWKSLCMGRCA
jgi:putative protease